MPRRRKPDLWEHVRDGDIVSFSPRDPKSKVPSLEYVRSIRRRDDGRHVIIGNSGNEIVEHVSYRIRLDQRSVIVELQNNGVIPIDEFWGGTLWFDWRGKRHPHIRIDFPVTQPVWFYFENNTGSVIVHLHGAPVIFPKDGERYQPRTRAMRLVDGALVHLGLGEPVHNLDGDLVISSGEHEVYDEFFDATPGLRERLTAIAQWMPDHRVDLSDPQVTLRS